MLSMISRCRSSSAMSKFYRGLMIRRPPEDRGDRDRDVRRRAPVVIVVAIRVDRSVSDCAAAAGM